MRIPSSLAIFVFLAGCSSNAGSGPIPPGVLGTGAQPSTASWNYSTLYAFTLGKDGVWPTTSLASLQGVLYGTTYGGGGTPHGRCRMGCGTVYAITTSGNEHVLYAFKGGSDGAIPQAAVTVANGSLYGTTFFGGKRKPGCSADRGCGTIYQVSPSGDESVLYAFKGGDDGSNPQGGLLFYDGRFYGTTTGGLIGRTCPGRGTVFSLGASSSGWHETILHRFHGGSHDGACPTGNLVELGGKLYGVTSAGGGADVGTVFQLAPNGSGEKLLWSATPDVGDYPAGITASESALFGVTSSGGRYKRGIVFSLTPRGQFAVLHDFVGHDRDGASPFAAPTFYDGKLYGTTQGGGAEGVGTIYRLTTVKPFKKTILYSFLKTPDGHQPVSALLQSGGSFYGTTPLGGNYASLNGIGTVFQISP